MNADAAIAVACAGVAATLLAGPFGDVGAGVRRGPEPMSDRWIARWSGIVAARLTGRHRRPDLAELMGSLSGELAAGQPLTAALISAASGLTPIPCPNALLAAQRGGSVAEALRLDAAKNGCAELRSLAACWEVACASGTGLATAVARLAATSRTAAKARGELTAELAATRASGRLLMFLPVLGIATGIWIGADPIHWFVSTMWGRIAFVVGVGLQVVAALWLRRITDRAAVSL